MFYATGDIIETSSPSNSTFYFTFFVFEIFSTGLSTNKVIVVGDMNAYSSEEPIEAWYSTQFGQYYDALNKQAAEPWLYSYLFDGQFGSLDHAFVPVNSLEEMSIAGAAIWNINSDELDIHDYNTDYSRNKDIFNADEPYRFSDHDPILLSIKFEPTLTSTSSLPPSGNGNGGMYPYMCKILF